jgi:nicotinate dehydrogenase subunit B
MSERIDRDEEIRSLDEPIELDRFEAFAPPVYHFDVDRRDFMKAIGGGIGVFLLVRAPSALAQKPGAAPAGDGMPPLPKNIGAWLHIAPKGAVTVFTGKVEVGQNVRTSLAQQVAAELKVEMDAITMVMGDTSRTPYDMGTFGSRTTPTMGPQLRRVAAAAREMLIELAADRWKTPKTQLVAENGKITDPSANRSIGYGELAEGQTLSKTIIAEDPLIPPSKWTVAGTPVPKVDAIDFVTGRHKYTPDIRLPGMMYGKVLRAPAFGATLASLDASAAKAIPGVVVVHDGNFAGVAAPTPEAAEKALAALKATWNPAPPQPSWKDIFPYLKQHVVKDDVRRENGFRFDVRHVKGSVNDAMASAAHRFEQSYNIAYIAHNALEPNAAVAEWTNGKLTVWTGTQRPFPVRDSLAELFHLSKDDVRVMVPDTGSAYGGKHTGDAAPEAARLARAAGKPVKVFWTREEQFVWAYFRPAGVIDIRAGLSADGKLVAWEMHNYNSGPAAVDTQYDVPNQHIEFHPVDSPLRQGSYRGLAATANCFARETAMNELAELAGVEPLEFRLKHLSDQRLKDVYLAAAKKFGWPRKKTMPGQGFGFGGGIEKGGRVATCVEVYVDPKSGDVHVKHVVVAFECGAIVNPDGLENQVVGVQMMGLGGALFEVVKFADGKILNPLFSEYRLPRFSDRPQIDAVLVDRKDRPPAGAGETPLFGLCPAIAHAIYDATGTRLRAMPLVPDGLKKS